MKKFRIVEKPNGFYIQKKFLGLFWINYIEPNYSFSYYVFGWVKDRGTVWVYDSLFNARRRLEMIKKFPIEYEGHMIAYGRHGNNEFKYIDLNSLTSNYKGRSYYSRVSNTLDYLKEIIHQYEINKKKNKNKILKVYEDLSS